MLALAQSTRSSIASKVAGPSRRSVTWFPLDTSAAAMRQRPRANEGPGTVGTSAPPRLDRRSRAGNVTSVPSTGCVPGSGSVATGRILGILGGELNLGAFPPPPVAGAAKFSPMLSIDLSGRRALVAGVADDAGFGFAIAKALAEAGASVSVGTWPPALNIFMNLLERGKMDESRRLSSGEVLTFEKIYALDAIYDRYDDIPE